MEFRVVDRRSLDEDDWSDLAGTGSFFHTIHWADVCVAGLPRGVEAVFLCGYETGRLVAGMPAVITRHFGMRSFYAMPYGTYGHALFREATPERKRGFYGHLLDHLRAGGYSRIVITDFNGGLGGIDRDFLEQRDCFTHVISLNGDGEHTPPDKKLNGHIRSGQRALTEIVRIDDGDRLDEFYRLYSLTERRHGAVRPLYRKRFFRALLEKLGGSSMLYWNGLNEGGRLVGSCINFIHVDTLFNWQTVSDYENRHLKPNHVLLADAIERGAATGVKMVNLGASPENAHGLIDYKERWGGKRVDYAFYVAASGLRRLLRR